MMSLLGGETVANSIREEKGSSPEKGASILHILPITICTEGVFLLNTEWLSAYFIPIHTLTHTWNRKLGIDKK